MSTETAENCIVVVPGANLDLSVGDVQNSDFTGAKIVVCQNEISPETTKAALQKGKSDGLITVYSPGIRGSPFNLIKVPFDFNHYFFSRKFRTAEDREKQKTPLKSAH